MIAIFDLKFISKAVLKFPAYIKLFLRLFEYQCMTNISHQLILIFSAFIFLSRLNLTNLKAYIGQVKIINLNERGKFLRRVK